MSETKTLTKITLADVEKHNTEEDCWCIIGNAETGGPMVYNVTAYLDDHPGGAEVLLDIAGQNADDFFEDIGHSMDARTELKKHHIGVLHVSEEERLKMEADARAKREHLAAHHGSSNKLVFLVLVLALAAAYYKTQLAV